jgi:hypothetical protein
VRIEYRWLAGDPARGRKGAAELIALDPDVIFASGGAAGSVIASSYPHGAGRIRVRHRSGRQPNKRKLTPLAVTKLRPQSRPYLVWDVLQCGYSVVAFFARSCWITALVW